MTELRFTDERGNEWTLYAVLTREGVNGTKRLATEHEARLALLTHDFAGPPEAGTFEAHATGTWPPACATCGQLQWAEVHAVSDRRYHPFTPVSQPIKQVKP